MSERRTKAVLLHMREDLRDVRDFSQDLTQEAVQAVAALRCPNIL